MYIPFLMYKCHGMTKFCITRNKTMVSRKADVATQALIITFVIIWGICCWFLSINFNQRDLLVRLFVETVTIFTTAAVSIFFVMGLISNQQLATVFYQINKFDKELLKTVEVKLFYKQFSKKIVFVRVPFWLLLFLTNVAALFSFKKYGAVLSIFEFLIYYYFLSMSLTSSSLYCCLIMECQRRVKFTNDYLEKLFFGNRFIPCIEAKLTPVVNASYKMDEILTELSGLIDTVENINRYFEIQLFLKSINMFISVVWSAYSYIDEFNKNLDLIESLRVQYFMLVWAGISLADFCIDVHIYRGLLSEVRNLFSNSFYWEIIFLRLISRKNSLVNLRNN